MARINRDNQILDFITGERYYLEVRRPYLPFAVLSIATGAYAVNRFQEYDRLHKKAEKQRESEECNGSGDCIKYYLCGIALYCSSSFGNQGTHG